MESPLTNRRTFLSRSAWATLAMPFLPSINSLFPDPPPQLKLSLNAYSFNRLLQEGKTDLMALLDFCAQYNFDALDPTGYYFPNYPAAPPATFLYEFKRKAFLLGLDMSGTGIRNDFTVSDPQLRANDLELIKRWVEVAAQLGAPCLRIFAGKDREQGVSREDKWKWVLEGIAKSVEIAAPYGIIIALQNHADFLHTADEIDRIFDAIDSPWLGLNLDIGSFDKKEPYTEIAQALPHAVTWQIKEQVWIGGEKVATDYEKLFSLIYQHKYRGYLPLETLGPGDPYEKVPHMLKSVRKVLEQWNVGK